MAKKTVAVPASTSILVAAVQLKGGGVTVDAGSELTQSLLKEMGLDQNEDELVRLKERGFVKTMSVRAAEAVVTPEAAEIKAANDRADAAEVKAAELQKQVDQLTADLAAAKKPA